MRNTVREFLLKGVQDEAFRLLLERALTQRPFVLSEKGLLRAAPLVVGAFQAAGGNPWGGLPRDKRGIQAAAAMELLLVSLHLFDGLADGDATSSSSDMQVGLGLQFLTGFALEQARASSGDWGPVYAMLTTVCAGQQRDVDLQREASPGLEDAKLMTLQKTGAFGEALTVVGAIAAQAPQDLVKELALIGQMIGMAGQLVDDAADSSASKVLTSDIRLRKKTLPVAVFLDRTGDDAERDALRTLLQGDSVLSPEQELAVRQGIKESGGTEVALLLASWYRMKAAGLVDRLQKRGCNTQILGEHLQLEERISSPPGGDETH